MKRNILDKIIEHSQPRRSFPFILDGAITEAPRKNICRVAVSIRTFSFSIRSAGQAPVNKVK